MKKKIAALFTIMLSIVMFLFMDTISFFAIDKNDVIKGDDFKTQISEQKILCTAEIEDNFEDDSVLIVYNNKHSLGLNEFDVDDFSGLGVQAVKDITSYTTREIKTTLSEKVNSIEKLIASNAYCLNFPELIETKMVNKAYDEVKKEYSDFHQTIEIRLNKKSKQNVLDVIHKLEKSDDVIAVEPNYIVEIDSSQNLPNDTYVSNQWAISKINLPQAWDITTGTREVNVGILDTGIKADHPDLKQNVDIALGKSFLDDSPYTDEYGHGTHVAGIVGAVGNNNSGVTGTCWETNLISLKVFDSKGVGNAAYVAEAIDYAKANNIDILNFSGSFEGSKKYQKNCQALINAMNNYDGLFVCSAANQAINVDSPGVYQEGRPFSLYRIYPATYENDNIIAVAATNEDDDLWYNGIYDGSSYGVKSIDLAAPGFDIYSTYIGEAGNNDYVNLTGTSMAAPYVTGVAALIKSQYPAISYKGIKKAILDGTDEVDSLTGKVKTGGRLNAYNALLAVDNCKFFVEYDKNGGSGDSMSNTVVTYGIPAKLSKNQYIPSSSDTLFSGWYAYRQSDNKWYYVSSDDEGWYSEGEQPAEYEKFLFRDKVYVAHLTSQNNDIIKMYAQWINKSDIMIGDVDLSGTIDIEDATMVQSYVAGLCGLDDVQKYAADVNQNGVIDIIDATEIQKIVAGIS